MPYYVFFSEILYFNTSYVAVQPRGNEAVSDQEVISIHLMLRFNNANGTTVRSPVGFQYILCCGSTELDNLYSSFPCTFQYILCCGSTILFLFQMMICKIFQYILCCGSTKQSKTKKSIGTYFNTSYVAVQLL